MKMALGKHSDERSARELTLIAETEHDRQLMATLANEAEVVRSVIEGKQVTELTILVLLK